jgi:hypothetical protein
MSAPARLPVWELAALAPAELVPALSTTTGLAAAADAAACTNALPETMLSR